MPDIVTIDRLGHQGDGTASLGGKQIFVPFTLEGEKVLLSGLPGRGNHREVAEIVEPSQDRISPICPHFGDCGGCQLQHFSHEPYLAWKRALLVSELEREGIDVDVAGPVSFPAASRRRAVLTAIHTSGGTHLGFQGRGSHEVIDIATCPVMTGELQAALPAVRSLAGAFVPPPAKGKPGSVRVTMLSCDNGIDIAFAHGGKVTARDLETAARHPASKHFLRISLNGEVLHARQRPILTAGTARVSPPPEAFAQAVAGAEQAMADLVCEHLSPCKRTADLFAGFGTFALRLAQNSMVAAYEFDAPALAAMDRAWRETGGALKTITHERRDLFRRPVMASELKKIDGAVFDPPRAGAEAQARELAMSKVRKVAAVSCNPQTLARDLRILIEGGYKLVSVTAIDQFAFTPHLEAVALLEW
ncbi:MAG: class I SAM-dependent RNA methyltransferase [Nitratireductor sp.]|nr:class I SAM-dependent RNA methyltransferase [Nitratireductor sp.]